MNTTVPDFPTNHTVIGHVGGYYGGKVLICRGAAYYQNSLMGKSVCFFWTPGDPSWVSAPNLRTGRTSGASAEVPGLGLVVTGGYDSLGLPLGSAEVFDGSDWRELTVTHEPVYDHCVASIKESMLMLTGGKRPSMYSALSQAVVLWLDSGETKDMPDMTSARAKHGCAMTEQGYVVAGGFGLGGNQLDTVELFTFLTLSGTQRGFWQPLTSLPRARGSPGVVYSHKQLLVVGGQVDISQDCPLTLSYNWNLLRWEEWGNFNNTRRLGHVTVHIQSTDSLGNT